MYQMSYASRRLKRNWKDWKAISICARNLIFNKSSLFPLVRTCFSSLKLEKMVFIYTFWFSLFVYRLYSRIAAPIVCSSFAKDYFRKILTSFKHHFKKRCCGCYMKKITLISVVLKWGECLRSKLHLRYRLIFF